MLTKVFYLMMSIFAIMLGLTELEPIGYDWWWLGVLMVGCVMLGIIVRDPSTYH